MVRIDNLSVPGGSTSSSEGNNKAVAGTWQVAGRGNPELLSVGEPGSGVSGVRRVCASVCRGVRAP